MKRYDDVCPAVGAPGSNPCELKISIDQDIEGPVYVYYQLENFYQNHRRYVKSRDYKQLMGEPRTLEDVKDNCDPITTNADIAPDLYSAFDKTIKLDPEAVAVPCGLVAKSMFTDTFTLNLGPIAITMDDSKIAWQSDVEYKFKNSENVNQ